MLMKYQKKGSHDLKKKLIYDSSKIFQKTISKYRQKKVNFSIK